MAVPKRKTSRANTRSRRAQWKAKPVPLTRVIIDGKPVLVPLRLKKAAERGMLR
ncbi:50S ribosomal protein L32 [Blastococcus saxobsidens]|uniref:Large ribosomal subunit protein bL32 n=1 Tax=Blastococcus saxobsidens TaxID=138336 RepID=A0A4Q7YBG9_9ACTN|nr:50S ribosomal protein L32 [Blastococcus saxobsidens]RZU33509.1 large subunit ribosomal protein L32 [Blastococcus saxobsidens]